MSPPDAHIPRFSLKHLLVAFAGVSGVLGLFMTFGYGAASALVLAVGIWLTASGIRKQRIRRKAVGVPLAFVGGCGTGLALVIWLVFGLGPIYLPAYYPAPVQQMIAVAGADPWKTKVYQYDNWLFIEYVCQMNLSQGQVDRVVAELELVEATENDMSHSFLRLFPRRWRPRANAQSIFYKASNNDPLYEAIYDPNSGRFSIWAIEDNN